MRAQPIALMPAGRLRAARRAFPLAVLTLAACGGSTPAPVPQPAPAPDAPATAAARPALPAPPVLTIPAAPAGARYRVVFYATDRAATSETDPWARFGIAQGELTTGLARVAIPTDRTLRPTGQLPAVPTLGPVRLAPDPTKHIILDRVEPLAQAPWLALIRQQLDQDTTRRVLVFVHGFANSFEDVARRGAQVANDLPFAGPVIVYSWPSQGATSPLGYFRDSRTIDASQAPLRAFLSQLTHFIEPSRIHLVAHSMGTLLVARTLKELQDAQPGVRRVNQLVLMAPDIDTTTFRRSFAEPLRASAERVTIYTSRNDTALDYSQKASSYPRVGQGLIVVPGIDFVDASVAKGTEFGHGYYGGSNAVLSDLRDVLLGRPPEQRRIDAQLRGGQRVWDLLSGE